MPRPQTGPIRYGKIWENLPLRAKVAISLFLPVPFVALTGIVLGLLGLHQFQLLLIPGLLSVGLAGAWALESILRWIGDVKYATTRLRRGESMPEIRPHSWELNDVGRELESIASLSKENQRVIEQGRERENRLFGEAPVAYLEADLEGQIRCLNRSGCELLGRTAEEIAGKPVGEVLGPDDAPDREYVRPDGTRLLVSISEDPQHDDSGTATGIRYTILDITERRLAAEKMEHCDRELQRKDEEVARALAEAAEARAVKTRFLSGMSDELRVPLNGIIGFTELLFDAKVGPLNAEQRECLGDILTSACHLLQLTNDLLAVAKTEPGKQPVARREAIDLAALIRDERYVLEILCAQRRKVRIAVEVDPRIGRVSIDPACLKQVLHSFVSGAVALTPEGGKVMLRAGQDGPGAFRLEVEHSRSVSLEKLDELGERRYPAHEAGLAEAKDAVEKQGGRVGVRNMHGKGTVFYAVLPSVEGGEVPKPAAVRIVEDFDEERRVRDEEEMFSGMLKHLNIEGRKRTA